jgi:hypothetical protein
VRATGRHPGSEKAVGTAEAAVVSCESRVISTQNTRRGSATTATSCASLLTKTARVIRLVHRCAQRGRDVLVVTLSQTNHALNQPIDLSIPVREDDASPMASRRSEVRQQLLVHTDVRVVPQRDDLHPLSLPQQRSPQ